MKKIVMLISIACISISIVGCALNNTWKGSEVKTVLESNSVESTGTKKLKPLELPSSSTPNGYLSETIIVCDLPKFPENVEVFEPRNIREANGTINYPQVSNLESSYSTDEALLPELATKVAKEFLAEKGVNVSNENISVRISRSTTSYDGKVDALTISMDVAREIKGLRIYDGDIIVRVDKGYKVVGYKNTEFDLVSKGNYKIISPKKAVELIPKYMDTLDGSVFSKVGNITDINLCYFSLVQNNIQPVYVISGYTDKNNKEEKFRIIIPAIKK